MRVHQIWLGDRRDDAAAATYSAEDLVLVQRDIGKLAQYTIEMGGTVELLEVSLRIPPWEPMRALTRDELRRMNLDNSDVADARPANPEAATTAAPSSLPVKRIAMTGQREREKDRGWVMAERAGNSTLTRRHPLTVEGEELGSFEVAFACGSDGQRFSAALYRNTPRRWRTRRRLSSRSKCGSAGKPIAAVARTVARTAQSAGRAAFVGERRGARLRC